MGQRSRLVTKHQADDRRGSARQRGYDSKWERARLHFLAEHPLCRMCEQHGKVVPASVVDHVIPHRGDAKLFWSRSNWQPLCETHHNSTKQKQERTGGVIGSDLDGRPLDPNHPWNRA
jgi:5-methylcytosine-specific restriction endonuclease McrA